tara:strand:+ start:22 stop:681 length:660 start_codon:yes stop_codon:yes gene_type:complete
MCDPSTSTNASFNWSQFGQGMEYGAIGANMLGQRNAAKEANRHAARLERLNTENAVKSTNERLNIAEQQFEMASKRTAFEIQNALSESRKARATSTTSAAESGVAGQSIDLLDQQLEKTFVDYEQIALLDLDIIRKNTNLQKKQIVTGGQRQIITGMQDRITPPSFAQGLLQIGGLVINNTLERRQNHYKDLIKLGKLDEAEDFLDSPFFRRFKRIGEN